MTDPITQAEVEEAQALLAKATPEPWNIELGHRNRIVRDAEGDTIAEVHWWIMEHAEESKANAALIVLMRSMFPRLLAERDHANKILAGLPEAVEQRARAERAKAECAAVAVQDQVRAPSPP